MIPALWMEMIEKVEWKYASTILGDLFVVIRGILRMQQLPADNSDILLKVSNIIPDLREREWCRL